MYRWYIYDIYKYKCKLYIYVNDIKKRIAFENLNDMNMVVFDVYDIFYIVIK